MLHQCALPDNRWALKDYHLQYLVRVYHLPKDQLRWTFYRKMVFPVLKWIWVLLPPPNCVLRRWCLNTLFRNRCLKMMGKVVSFHQWCCSMIRSSRTSLCLLYPSIWNSLAFEQKIPVKLRSTYFAISVTIYPVFV